MPRNRTRHTAQYEPEYEAPPHSYNPRDTGLRSIVILLAVAFMVTLGVVVCARLSNDAIAVLVGVIAGVAASIPCALILMAVTRRREEYETQRAHDRVRYDPHAYPEVRPAPPPVIVVTSGNGSPQQFAPWADSPGNGHTAPGFQTGGYQASTHTQRPFRVMGYDEDQEDA